MKQWNTYKVTLRYLHVWLDLNAFTQPSKKVFPVFNSDLQASLWGRGREGCAPRSCLQPWKTSLPSWSSLQQYFKFFCRPVCTYSQLLISLFPLFWNSLIMRPSKHLLLQYWPGALYLEQLILPIWDSWMGEGVGFWWEGGGMEGPDYFSSPSPKGRGPDIKGKEAKNIMYVKITNFRCKIYTSSLRKRIFLDTTDKFSRKYSLLSIIITSGSTYSFPCLKIVTSHL